MGKAEALLHPVREVLWIHWDPIGVNSGDPYDTENADLGANEYDSYGSGLVKLMLAGTDETALTKRLGQLSKNAMGIPPNVTRDAQVAARLLGLLAKDT